MAAFVLTRNLRFRLGLGLLILVAGATFLGAYQTNHIPWYFAQRFAAAGSDNFGSRLPGWQIGVQLFEQNPLAGLGNGGFQTYITSYHVGYALATSPHSDYVGTLADTGLIGFILLLTMLTTLGSTIVLKARRHPASIIIFFVLAIDMAAGSILEEHWIWVAFGIATAYGLTTEVSTQSKTEQPENLVSAPLSTRVPAATFTGG
jgi:O-antigen ligase